VKKVNALRVQLLNVRPVIKQQDIALNASQGNICIRMATASHALASVVSVQDRLIVLLVIK